MMILGAAAGWLGARAMGMRTDPVTALALGCLGALVGVMGLRLVLTLVHWGATLAAALLGALLMVWLWRVLVERR